MREEKEGMGSKVNLRREESERWGGKKKNGGCRRNGDIMNEESAVGRVRERGGKVREKNRGCSQRKTTLLQVS